MKTLLILFLSIVLFYQTTDGIKEDIKYTGEITIHVNKLLLYFLMEQIVYVLFQIIAWKRRKYPSYYSGFV